MVCQDECDCLRGHMRGDMSTVRGAIPRVISEDDGRDGTATMRPDDRYRTINKTAYLAVHRHPSLQGAAVEEFATRRAEIVDDHTKAIFPAHAHSIIERSSVHLKARSPPSFVAGVAAQTGSTDSAPSPMGCATDRGGRGASRRPADIWNSASDNRADTGAAVSLGVT